MPRKPDSKPRSIERIPVNLRQVSDRTFEGICFSFFDKHPAFQKLAGDVCSHSFFVTGGSGVFGQWILTFFDWAQSRKLASPELTVLSRRQPISPKCYWNVLRGDITDFQAPDRNYDYLIHLAAPSAQDTFAGMEDREKFKQLFNGAERILAFAEKHIEKRSLIASSGAIYGGFGRDRVHPISEDERLAPLFSSDVAGFALGKRVLEMLTSDACRRGGVDASIARCFGFVGPKLPTNLHYAVGNFIANAVARKALVINGDGSPVRSFMYLGDMVSWLLTILFRGSTGSDYNVGSANPITIHDLAQLVARMGGRQSEVRTLCGSNKSVGNPSNYYYVPDTTKAREQLDLFELTSLEEALNIFFEYQRMC